MPFLTFQIETSTTNQRLLETLKPSVSKLKWFSFKRVSTPFWGTISDNGFRIVRTTKGRDSFNPLIIGRIHNEIQGTRIRIFMTFHPIVWLFIIAWPFLVMSDSPLRFTDPSLFGLIFLLWPLVMGIPFFFYEASKSKRLLLQTLGLF